MEDFVFILHCFTFLFFFVYNYLVCKTQNFVLFPGPLIFKWERLGSNVQEHWTRWDVTTCPVLYNFCTRDNISTDSVLLCTEPKPLPIQIIRFLNFKFFHGFVWISLFLILLEKLILLSTMLLNRLFCVIDWKNSHLFHR